MTLDLAVDLCRTRSCYKLKPDTEGPDICLDSMSKLDHDQYDNSIYDSIYVSDSVEKTANFYATSHMSQ